MDIIKVRDKETGQWVGIPALVGPKGDPFTYEDFTPEQLESLRGQQGPAGQPGRDGIDGKDGQDGYTPQKGVDYFDGEPGQPGEKGDPFTYDDFTPEQLAALTGPQGADGHTPVKGTDYWTEDDQQAIVNDVLAALPTWEGGSY